MDESQILAHEYEMPDGTALIIPYRLRGLRKIACTDERGNLVTFDSLRIYHCYKYRMDREVKND